MSYRRLEGSTVRDTAESNSYATHILHDANTTIWGKQKTPKLVPILGRAAPNFLFLRHGMEQIRVSGIETYSRNCLRSVTGTSQGFLLCSPHGRRAQSDPIDNGWSGGFHLLVNSEWIYHPSPLCTAPFMGSVAPFKLYYTSKAYRFLANVSDSDPDVFNATSIHLGRVLHSFLSLYGLFTSSTCYRNDFKNLCQTSSLRLHLWKNRPLPLS